jgi:hypothetical protein
LALGERGDPFVEVCAAAAERSQRGVFGVMRVVHVGKMLSPAPRIVPEPSFIARMLAAGSAHR